jgi:hypothetical protein
VDLPGLFRLYDGGGVLLVSATDARHSRNLAGRPQVSIVVFDSKTQSVDMARKWVVYRGGRVP